MGQPKSARKSGKSILEKRRQKQAKRAEQATATRKRDRMHAS
jgi:hypothetical protein